MEKQEKSNYAKNSSEGNSQTILDPNDISISVSGMLKEANNNVNLINEVIDDKKPEEIVDNIAPQNDINKEEENCNKNNDNISNQQNKSTVSIAIFGEDSLESNPTFIKSKK